MKMVLPLLFALFILSCSSGHNDRSLSVSDTPVTVKVNAGTIENIEGSAGIDISDYTDTLIVDGFDYPIGNRDGKGAYTCITDGKKYDSWKVSTTFCEVYSLGIHPGVDYNGTGGGNTDLGQPVNSIARGVVVSADDYGAPWGGVVLIKHKYLENGKISFCYSLYAHLEDIQVKKDDIVSKRQQVGVIGTGDGSYYAHLHLEIRNAGMEQFQPTYWPSSDARDAKWIGGHYSDPELFIKDHRKLTCPAEEDKLILAVKNKYKLYYFVNGKIVKEYEIALSQSPVGHKLKQGDNKMPEGEYYITEKQKGPFYGDFADFLGPCILRISYPNIYDAENGYKAGTITKAERDKIIEANKAKTAPPKYTGLGGGIVIHGWNGDWVADGTQNLTWGCISMHNNELEEFYKIAELKTKIIISE